MGRNAAVQRSALFPQPAVAQGQAPVATIAETLVDHQGRVRFSRNIFVDFSYDTLSARYFGIPQFTLQNNLTLIDGVQILRVPPQQGNLGIDYSDGRRFEVRLGGFYVGNNNGLQRPPYTYFNGFVSKRLKSLTFALGGYNVFNSGIGEQFGLPARSIVFPVTQHFK